MGILSLELMIPLFFPIQFDMLMMMLVVTKIRRPNTWLCVICTVYLLVHFSNQLFTAMNGYIATDVVRLADYQGKTIANKVGYRYHCEWQLWSVGGVTCVFRRAGPYKEKF